jgi:hypothetical protein
MSVQIAGHVNRLIHVPGLNLFKKKFQFLHSGILKQAAGGADGLCRLRLLLFGNRPLSAIVTPAPPRGLDTQFHLYRFMTSLTLRARTSLTLFLEG